MTPIHRGRGGSVTRTAEVARLILLALFCFVLGAAGCSSKKAQGLEGVNNGGATVGNEKMTDQSTLEKFKTGQLGGGEGGPLTDIHFGYNDYTVQPQDSSILRTNANWLQSHPNSNVQVEGNCDERGSEEYNIALGAKRAQAAKDYLTTLGIPASRISTISYGKELPICHESTEDCWAQNRRDHFAVSGSQAGQ